VEVAVYLPGKHIVDKPALIVIAYLRVFHYRRVLIEIQGIPHELGLLGDFFKRAVFKSHIVQRGSITHT
jgi:hypothetical protein